MTRINIVPVEELADQHLFAEYRELPRMAKYVLIAKNPEIPKSFTLNAGHMKFFLNKPTWLEERHRQLTAECLRRGINLTPRPPFKMERIYGDVAYTPSPTELTISQQRIDERLALRPGFYRWSKKPQNKLENPH